MCMMIKYVVVNGVEEEEPDKGWSAGSGIAAYQNKNLVACIGDIAPNRFEVERLAGLLNRLEVSLVHFYDVVADYVAER